MEFETYPVTCWTYLKKTGEKFIKVLYEVITYLENLLAGISKCRNSFQIQTSKWAHFSPIMVFSDLLRLSGNYLSSSPTWLTAPPTSHMKGLLSLVEWFLSQLAIVYNLRAAFH